MKSFLQMQHVYIINILHNFYHYPCINEDLCDTCVSLRKLETSTMIVSVPSELSQWRHKCGFRRSIQKHSRGLKFPSCHCNSVEWSRCLAHESCFVESPAGGHVLLIKRFWVPLPCLFQMLSCASQRLQKSFLLKLMPWTFCLLKPQAK